MSVLLKKDQADRVAFSYKPKALKADTAKVVKEFVDSTDDGHSAFQIADVVAKQSGVSALRKKQIEAQVEETVLARLKEIEEQAYKQAHDLGVIEGSEKAYAEKREALQESLQNFDNSTKSLNAQIENLCRQYESDIMRMIFRIAEKIAMREIAKDEKIVADVVSKIVTELQAAQRIKVLLNPNDMKTIDDLRAKGAKEVEGLDRVKFEAKQEISQGGCLVETDFGTIDATIEQRVEKAWQAIESKLPIVQGTGKT